MRFGISSILLFLLGLTCYGALIVGPGWPGFVSTTLVFLQMLSFAVGLTAAFIGALKHEKPARHAIIGFVLNAIWFAFLAVPAAMSLVGSSSRAHSQAHMAETWRTHLAASYGRYMLKEHPSRGNLFYKLTCAIGQLSGTSPVSKKNLVKYLGEPDSVRVSDSEECFAYSMSPIPGVKAKRTVHIYLVDDRVALVGHSADTSAGSSGDNSAVPEEPAEPGDSH